MQVVAETAMMLASFHFAGAEIVLILAVGLVLFGARNLPELARGLGQGIIEFRRATKRLTDATDEEAGEAGRSVGGIYGTPAAQALTPDNQVAELYDPAVLRNETQRPERCNRMRNGFIELWSWMRRFARRFLGQH